MKGHIKLTLHNPITGKNEIHEKDNLITNAVADLLASNLNAQGNFSKCLPLKQFFSGVMCFEDPLPANANAYWPPAESVNRMIAHAGDEAHSTASLLRGNPNASEMITTDTAQKFVWDWSTSAGIGQISTVCLCPNRMGNMGLKPFDNTYNPIKAINTPNRNASVNLQSLTRDYAIQHPIEMDINTGLGKALWISGTSFEEITVKHEMLKFGILRDSTPETFIEVSHRGPISVSGLSDRSWALFVDDDYYYIIRGSSATTLEMNKISKSTFTNSVQTFTISGGDVLRASSDDQFGRWSMFPHFMMFDGFLFWPKRTLDAWYRIKISDGTFTELAGTVSSNLNNPSRPIRISNGLYLGTDYLYNSGTFYPIAGSDSLFVVDGTSQTMTDARYDSRNYLSNGTPALWANESGAYINANGVMVNEMFLSSIANLDNPVVKTSAQSMKIEYTLTEQ